MYATEVQINPDAIPATDRGFQYGDGIFETILNFKHHPVLLDLHIERLKFGLKLLDIPLSGYVLEDLIQAINSLCRKKSGSLLKIIVTRGNSSQGYRYDHQCVPNVYVFEKDFVFKPSNPTNAPVLPFVLSGSQYLARAKHLNRIEQVLASTYLKSTQFDGVLCDEEGNFIEGCSSNIFFKYDGCWVTPRLTTTGVAGTLRQFLLSQSQAIGVDLVEMELHKSKLPQVSAAFFCNSVRGIVPISRIGEQSLNVTDEGIIKINDFFLNKLLLAHGSN